MIPLNPIKGTNPLTYPNWIKFDVPIAKNMNPYILEPILWPKSNWEKDGAKLNVAPIMEFANKI